MFLSVLLVVISRYNFLLFHTLAELFAIVVAVLMGVVAWQMYPFTRNNYLMYLGTGYFWIAVLDLMHAFAYKDMNILEVTGPNVGTQYWIMTRYLEALLLLSAPWFLNHHLRYKAAFYIFGFITFLVLYAIQNGYMPTTFIEGEGLTSFKIYSEYIIIALLALSILHISRKSEFIDQRIQYIVIIAIGLTMCAELAFTFYIDVFGLSNVLGHVFKLFSFWLVFIAMIRVTLQEPYKAMARDSSTYDAIPDATILIDKNGVIRHVNLEACELAVLQKNELIGENAHNRFHPSALNEDNCPICINRKNGLMLKAFEIEDESKNKWFDFTMSPAMGVDDFDGTVEVIRDISRRKNAEDEYEILNKLKNSIVDNLPATLFVKNASDGRYVEWNKAAEELTGIKREEMIGRNDYDFFPVSEADLYTGMDKKVLSEGVLHDIPEETIHTKYKGLRLLHTRKIPIFNQSGVASYLLGISQDITEQRKTEEMLRRSQKMDAIGQLSGGIAHDFNNQLGIVMGYLEFLKQSVIGKEKQTVWIDTAFKAASRCVELTKQLLLFSRTNATDKNVVVINETIIAMEDVINKSVTPEVKIDYQLDSNLKSIAIDKGELGDAIVNLVINSRDSMNEGGEIIVRTSNVYLDSEFVITETGLSTGEYVMLEIKDNGFGMSKDTLEHIFEPFFTTKEVGKGTGLGLAMVYAFVQRYEGTIKVDSELGKGTSIKLYIPCSENVVKPKLDDADIDRYMVFPRGKESVLIVDDEEDLLNLLGDYLDSLGYTVTKARNAIKALGILEKETFNMMFSDIVMPGGMSGYELAEKVNKQYPQMKILLSSGYGVDKAALSHPSAYNNRFINKPYTKQDIAIKVREMLDE